MVALVGLTLSVAGCGSAACADDAPASEAARSPTARPTTHVDGTEAAHAPGAGAADTELGVPEAPEEAGPVRSRVSPEEAEARARAAAHRWPRRCRIPSAPRPRAIVLRAEAVEYGRAGGAPMALDVVGPAREDPAPAILLVHGGGWRAGERAHVMRTARIFAGLGYAAVPVDYRLVAGETGQFPAAIADLRCAVRHLRDRAAEYRIDPTRIGVAGFSAGGHLAGLLATAADVEGLDGACPSSASAHVDAAVAYYGAFDLEGPFGRAARRLIRRFVGQREGVLAVASPITHIDADDPPILLAHGRSDRVVPVAQSRLFAAALREAGVRTEYVEVPHGVHGFTIFHETARDELASCATLRFLDESLQPTPLTP